MFFTFFSRPGLRARRKAGFTLVEMMVTLGIFAVISSVVLAGYRDFDGGIVLTNLAYEIAITIRQAQVYGLSARDAGTNPINVRYGIHLSWPTLNTVLMFADKNNNGTYTDSSEIVESLTTTRGNNIEDFCGVRTSDGVSECGTTVGVDHIDWLDITFLRGDDLADVTFKSSDALAVYKEATIVVKSPRTNRIKTVRVLSTGQISVE